MSALTLPEVLLFDAGNTLVFLDHEALATAALAVDVQVTGAALERAEPSAKRRYEAALREGMSHEDGWYGYVSTLYELAGVDAARTSLATHAARAAHDQLNLWRKVPSDLVPALERGRARGLRYGIVSNSEGQLRELLEHVELAHYFETIVDSGLEGVRKPDPEIFRRALTRLDARASATLYAGDIPQVDVDGARAAGLEGVLIDTLDHYADYTDAPRFRSVAALLAALCP